MTRRAHPIAIVVSTLAAACGTPGPERSGPPAGGVAPPGPARPAPGLDDLAGATYTGLVAGEPITLGGGVWAGPPAAPGAASRPRVELLRGVHATGDLTGDGVEEGVGLVAAGAGGTGTMLSLVIFGRDGDRVVHVGTAPLGDRVQVKAVRVDGRAIVADVVRHGAGDARCCPTERARLSWTLAGGTVMAAGDDTLGRLSLDDLAGAEWVLTHWGPDEPLAAGTAPVLTVSEGRFAGRTGCNRYTAAVSASKPGTFGVSRIVATRMACPPPGDAIERRFLERLQASHGYAFLGGDLLLTADDGSLRFRGRPRGEAGPAAPAVPPSPAR